MKVTKENAIASVQSSVSSIFSKEDVLSLINSIEAVPNRIISTQDIQTAVDNAIDHLERNSQDVIDTSTAEFSLSYDGRVELENVDLGFEYIREVLENNFMDFGEDLGTFGSSEESEMY